MSKNKTFNSEVKVIYYFKESLVLIKFIKPLKKGEKTCYRWKYQLLLFGPRVLCQGIESNFTPVTTFKKHTTTK